MNALADSLQTTLNQFCLRYKGESLDRLLRHTDECIEPIDLAKRIGCTRHSIYNYLNNKRNPDLLTCVLMCTQIEPEMLINTLELVIKEVKSNNV